MTTTQIIDTDAYYKTDASSVLADIVDVSSTDAQTVVSLGEVTLNLGINQTYVNIANYEASTSTSASLTKLVGNNSNLTIGGNDSDGVASYGQSDIYGSFDTLYYSSGADSLMNITLNKTGYIDLSSGSSVGDNISINGNNANLTVYSGSIESAEKDITLVGTYNSLNTTGINDATTITATLNGAETSHINTGGNTSLTVDDTSTLDITQIYGNTYLTGDGGNLNFTFSSVDSDLYNIYGQWNNFSFNPSIDISSTTTTSNGTINVSTQNANIGAGQIAGTLDITGTGNGTFTSNILDGEMSTVSTSSGVSATETTGITYNTVSTEDSSNVNIVGSWSSITAVLEGSNINALVNGDNDTSNLYMMGGMGSIVFRNQANVTLGLEDGVYNLDFDKTTQNASINAFLDASSSQITINGLTSSGSNNIDIYTGSSNTLTETKSGSSIILTDSNGGSLTLTNSTNYNIINATTHQVIASSHGSVAS